MRTENIRGLSLLDCTLHAGAQTCRLRICNSSVVGCFFLLPFSSFLFFFYRLNTSVCIGYSYPVVVLSTYSYQYSGMHSRSFSACRLMQDTNHLPLLIPRGEKEVEGQK